MNESTLSPAHAEAILENFARTIATRESDRNNKAAGALSERAYQLAALARGQNVRPGEDVRLETLRVDGFQSYMTEVNRQSAHTYDVMYDKLMAGCESPIEKLLAAALLPVTLIEELSSAQRADGGPPRWTIHPQYPIGRYRADFFIEANYDDCRSVIVECDGHDYHDRTKEQAARDKKRDRAIQAAGYPVLRFTGSELHRDAQACADEVLGFVIFAAESG